MNISRSKIIRRSLDLAMTLLSVLLMGGLFSFVRLGLWKYLFQLQEFFFFDIQQGIALFLLDYISIFVMLCGVEFFIHKIISKKYPKKSNYLIVISADKVFL